MSDRWLSLLVLGAVVVGCGSSSSPTGSAPRDSGVGGVDARTTGTDSGVLQGPGDSAAPPADSGQGSPESGGTSDASDASAPSNAWVMGYYAVWDEPANGGAYPVSAIDWGAITHVATAFYLPDASGGFGVGSFDATTATALITAAHAQSKKVIASIGGSGSGPSFEGATQSSMAAFVTSLQALLSMGYDGIDIDWEGGNLTAAQDQALEQALIHALRTGSPSALLTMTAGYENENSLDDLTFYGTVIADLDRLNLMTYGMSGAWQGWKSWHSSPLHWDHDTSTPTGIDTSVAHYLAAGVPAAKLGVGAGFYGECYTSPVTAPGQALGGSQVSASDGTMSYVNIMASYYSAATYHYDSVAAVPYLSPPAGNAQGCTYVTYEDATSLGAKAAWMKSQGLGGIIIWTMSEGFVSSGADVHAQNPLLEVLGTALE
jgi:chitinase